MGDEVGGRGGASIRWLSASAGFSISSFTSSTGGTSTALGIVII